MPKEAVLSLISFRLMTFCIWPPRFQNIRLSMSRILQPLELFQERIHPYSSFRIPRNCRMTPFLPPLLKNLTMTNYIRLAALPSKVRSLFFSCVSLFSPRCFCRITHAERGTDVALGERSSRYLEPFRRRMSRITPHYLNTLAVAEHCFKRNKFAVDFRALNMVSEIAVYRIGKIDWR